MKYFSKIHIIHIAQFCIKATLTPITTIKFLQKIIACKKCTKKHFERNFTTQLCTI